jgi:hypothetical protein
VRDTKKPRGLSLSGFSVNYMDAAIPLLIVWLPKCNSIRTTLSLATPEVCFRIVHIAQKGADSAPVAAYREQTVEIALGPKRMFQNGNVATVTQRVAPERVVTAAPARRPISRSPGEPRTPRVVELLRKAQEWRRQLDAGEVTTQAEISRQEMVTRARVTQVMGLLRLAPEIQHMILALPDEVGRPQVTERALRSLALLGDPQEQQIAFATLLQPR